MSLLFNGFYSSALSTFQWLYISGFGMFCKKYGYVDKKFKSCLSKVVTNVVLPCFVFAQIIVNFHISQYMLIFHSVVGNLVIYIFGLLVGYGLAKIFKFTKSQSDFLAAIYSTPHNTSIYVILIQVMGPYLDTIIPPDKNFTGNAAKRGLLYVIINSIFSNFWRWSICYYLIEPPPDDEEAIDEIKEPLIKEGGENINTNSINNNEVVSVEKPKKKYQEKNILQAVINMPFIVSLLTLFLTFFPSLQDKMISPGSFLRDTLVSVNETVAKSYAFIVIFILGISFSDSLDYKPDEKSKKKEFLTKEVLVWITFIKLIIMPMFTTPVIILLFRNVFHADDVLTFTFLFLGAVPPAINVIVICAYKDVYVDEISLIMIVMYIVSIISLTFSIALFFYILGALNGPLVATTIPVQ